MIRLTSKYNAKTENCKVKYSSEKSNTMEHLYAIRSLVEQILKNDPDINWEMISSILTKAFTKEEEEKEDGERDSESKAEV